MIMSVEGICVASSTMAMHLCPKVLAFSLAISAMPCRPLFSAKACCQTKVLKASARWIVDGIENRS